MTDQFIQVPVDSTGKKVDTSEVTRADTTVVERQRINISDPTAPDAHAKVGASDPSPLDSALYVRGTHDDDILMVLQEVLIELKRLRLGMALLTNHDLTDSDAFAST